MRDTIKNAEYFTRIFEDVELVIEDGRDGLQDDGLSYKIRLGMAYDNFREGCHKAIAIYSAGGKIDEVKAATIDTIDALDVFTKLGLEDEQYFLHGDGGGYSGGVEKWYWVLSFCILFDLPRDKSDIVLDHLSLQMRNPNFATDALANKMVKHLGYPGQDETDHLIWPEAYGPLYECFKINEAYRSDQLKTFVDKWYKEMGKGDAYWYENHKNKHDVYFGYWTFEAAAVAKMLRIHDEHLKDHPHYPYDVRHG